MNLDKELEAHKFNLQEVLHAFFESYQKDESAQALGLLLHSVENR